jgi:hypothetical protein
MPVLPSGRFIEIMSERARYHAVRLRLRVTQSTPHKHLYPLVDILMECPQGNKDGGSAFGFSGYTLSQMNRLDEWEECDRRFFLDWIREPTQVRTIEQARHRLLVENFVPKEQVYPYPLRLYSLLRERLQSLPMRRAPVGQWQRTLLNMKRGGIRREELDWSGVMAFLARRPAEQLLDKQAVLEAIDFSAIQPRLSNELECDQGCHLPFQEVAHKIEGYRLQLAGYAVGDEDVGVVRYCSVNPNYRVGRIWTRGCALQTPEQSCWFALGPYGQALAHPEDKSRLLFKSSQEARQAADRHALRSHRLRCDLKYRSPYEYMSLHGGEEYREWLVTLPDYHRSHFTGHYYERNILLHIRSKVRRTDNGSRVLFIEELQSDWHQAVARRGLRCGIPVAPFRKEWACLALKLMLLHVVERGLDGIAWADYGVHELRYDKAMMPLRRLYDQDLPRFLNRLAKPWRAEVGEGEFTTRHPWLHAVRSRECWKVEGGAGKFITRARYDKQQALALIERHSKAVTLSLPMLILPEEMRRHIAEHGLPLFGEQHVNENPQSER